MNGDPFVLDTNFVIHYLDGNPLQRAFLLDNIDAECFVSVITEIELYSFHRLSESEKSKLDMFFSTVTVAPLDDPKLHDRVKNAAIAFRRATRCKVPDAIIAATSITLGAVLVTSDEKLLKSAFPGFEVQSV